MSDAKIDDGGPAFPVEQYFKDASGAICDVKSRTCGMSLRDWFAGQALAGMLAYSSQDRNGNWANNASPDGVADGAYHYADAMLAARAKQPTHT